MQHLRRTPALLLLLSSLSCAACGAPQAVVTLAPRQPLPAEVWACPAQPQPPADGYADAALASWIADLADAGQDCRDQLQTAHAIVEGK